MAVDKNMRILIVDDYKTMLRIIRNLLKQLGFNNIDEATDGSMALQMLRSGNTYGLVITSYSIHYTKLYERARRSPPDGCRRRGRSRSR